MKKLSRLLGFILIAVALSACGSVALYHNLNEYEANRILVLLDDNNIKASKEKDTEGREVTWTVMVSTRDESAARRLLVKHNLPQRPVPGLYEVYEEKGLIPTPDEQRGRYLVGTKGELVKALRKFAGVHDVDVVLNIPKKEEISLGESEKVRPSASVVLRVGDPRAFRMEWTEESVKRFVANAIPEMDPNDVIVVITTEEGIAGTSFVAPTQESFPPPPREAGPPKGTESTVVTAGPEVSEESVGGMVNMAGILMDSESVAKFRFYLIVFLCVLILLSAALLLTLFRFSRMRRFQKPRRLQALSVEGQEGRPDLLTSGRQTTGVGPGPGETGT